MELPANFWSHLLFGFWGDVIINWRLSFFVVIKPVIFELQTVNEKNIDVFWEFCSNKVNFKPTQNVKRILKKQFLLYLNLNVYIWNILVGHSGGPKIPKNLVLLSAVKRPTFMGIFWVFPQNPQLFFVWSCFCVAGNQVA